MWSKATTTIKRAQKHISLLLFKFIGMSFDPLSSIETVKKWFDYWRKFKGKRVKIWLKKGLKFTKAMTFSGDSIEIDFPENVVGTISEVIESPFGIMLKDISSTENIEMTFIPMLEIAKMDFLKPNS